MYEELPSGIDYMVTNAHASFQATKDTPIPYITVDAIKQDVWKTELPQNMENPAPIARAILRELDEVHQFISEAGGVSRETLDLLGAKVMTVLGFGRIDDEISRSRYMRKVGDNTDYRFVTRREGDAITFTKTYFSSSERLYLPLSRLFMVQNDHGGIYTVSGQNVKLISNSDSEPRLRVKNFNFGRRSDQHAYTSLLKAAVYSAPDPQSI